MFKSMDIFTASSSTINVFSKIKNLVLVKLKVQEKNIPFKECIERLQKHSEAGLTTSEALYRINQYGFNEFELKEKDSLLKKYIEQVFFK